MPIEVQNLAALSWFSRGQELLGQRKIHAALECFDAAQSAGHALRECAAARWQCWMLLGDFERAWRESDSIESSDYRDANRFWDGRPWSGRRLMLRCLHGLGDTIQFIRYAPLLKQTCRSLTVQTHPELVTLLECVPAIDHVCTWGAGYFENHSDWDTQMEVTELPRAFRTTLKTIPATAPYIHLSRERIHWGATCLSWSDTLRVGIAWQASAWNPARSIPFADLEPLFTGGGCAFYSLQKDGGEAMDGGSALSDLRPHISDVCDTASLLLNLDLIVTVDTMVAHLAGALNRPVWILLPAVADWRWMLDRSDTPWYPSARIFRQRTAGYWGEVVEEVRAALACESSAAFLGGRLQPGHLRIPAPAAYQFRVAAGFHYTGAVDHHNGVRQFANSGQAVSDQNHRSAFQQRQYVPQNSLFGFGVERAGKLVQDDNAAIVIQCQEGLCQRDPLLLSFR